jgi:Raf kinase inhibitor-like YbhB/YbcL family protein
MRLSSSSFEDGQEIPRKHGKKFDNVSPQLSWTDAPPATRSFALSVVDWMSETRFYVHWLVVDLPADVASIAEGAVGDSLLPAGSLEAKPYAGPFPPSGTHTYEFTVYALDVPTLGIPKGTTLEAFTAAARTHVLAEAKLRGTFTAPKGE